MIGNHRELPSDMRQIPEFSSTVPERGGLLLTVHPLLLAQNNTNGGDCLPFNLYSDFSPTRERGVLMHCVVMLYLSQQIW